MKHQRGNPERCDDLNLPPVKNSEGCEHDEQQDDQRTANGEQADDQESHESEAESQKPTRS